MLETFSYAIADVTCLPPYRSWNETKKLVPWSSSTVTCVSGAGGFWQNGCKWLLCLRKLLETCICILIFFPACKYLSWSSLLPNVCPSIGRKQEDWNRVGVMQTSGVLVRLLIAWHKLDSLGSGNLTWENITFTDLWGSLRGHFLG